MIKWRFILTPPKTKIFAKKFNCKIFKYMYFLQWRWGKQLLTGIITHIYSFLFEWYIFRNMCFIILLSKSKLWSRSRSRSISVSIIIQLLGLGLNFVLGPRIGLDGSFCLGLKFNFRWRLRLNFWLKLISGSYII